MTERVDFYILKTAADKQRWVFVCRLIEKAYLLKLRIVVLTATLTDAQALDELLWTFNERCFIPHKLCLDENAIDPETPIHLTLDAAMVPVADLLLNLAPGLPSRLEGFNRVAEVIDANDDRRRLGRERFKLYRDLKLTLETHQIDETADA
jgi:DNA polymerase III subunit chi